MTVTALCPGPTATGFEKAAAMKNGSTMFRKAASAASAEAGLWAMEKERVLLYQGMFTKLMSLGARIAPRSVTRKFARKMNH